MVYYYPEFAWGNNERIWYLNNNEHDFFTQVKGFWP